MLQKLETAYKTRPGRFAAGVVSLALSYGFISLAIDHGNLWWYLLTLVFLVCSLQNFSKFIFSFFGRQKLRSAKK